MNRIAFRVPCCSQCRRSCRTELMKILWLIRQMAAVAVAFTAVLVCIVDKPTWNGTICRCLQRRLVVVVTVVVVRICWVDKLAVDVATGCGMLRLSRLLRVLPNNILTLSQLTELSHKITLSVGIIETDGYRVQAAVPTAAIPTLAVPTKSESTVRQEVAMFRQTL